MSGDRLPGLVIPLRCITLSHFTPPIHHMFLEARRTSSTPPYNCPLRFSRRIPKGLEDVSRYPYLFAELLRDTSWSVIDLQKLAGLNLIRTFRKVEQVSRKLGNRYQARGQVRAQ